MPDSYPALNKFLVCVRGGILSIKVDAEKEIFRNMFQCSVNNIDGNVGKFEGGYKVQSICHFKKVGTAALRRWPGF